jgi:hypothetical protein
LRRLVLLSALLTLGGLALLLPSSPLMSLLSSGSTSSGATTTSFVISAPTTDNTATIESLVGFGMIGVGVVLEIFSLFTDVGGALVSPDRPEAAEP